MLWMALLLPAVTFVSQLVALRSSSGGASFFLSLEKTFFEGFAKEMAGAGDGADGTDADIGVDYLFHVAGGSQHAAAEDTADEVLHLARDLVVRTGCGFLMVTHSARLAATLDRQVTLHAGRLA